MKKNILFTVWIALFSLPASNSQTQSLKDLPDKDNTPKVINAVIGTSETIDMIGTWTYSGLVVEFESDNLLMKAGGVTAAVMTKNKSNKQLSRMSTKEEQMSFTFSADSTFASTVGKKKLNGTYSYNASIKQVDLKYLKLLNLHAEVNCISNSMNLLFNPDRLLGLITFLGSKTSNAALKTINLLVESYDGMMLGLRSKKQCFICKTKSSETLSGKA